MSGKRASPLVRAGVDYAAPAAFLIAYLITRDFLAATWWLVGGSALALLVGWIVERRIAALPLLAGLAAVVFGSLTLAFNDTTFVKIKPTVINSLFAAGLLGGLMFKRLFLKDLLGESLRMADAAWRTLTVRYGVFFIAVACLNEAVWRTQPESTWVLFRMPGLLLLTIVFSLTQIPFMHRHGRLGAEETAPPLPPE